MIAAATALSHPSYPDPCQHTCCFIAPSPAFGFCFCTSFLPHTHPEQSSAERPTDRDPHACKSIQRQRTTVTGTATYTGTQVSWPCRREKARRGGCFLRVVGVIPAWAAGSLAVVAWFFFSFPSLITLLPCTTKKKRDDCYKNNAKKKTHTRPNR